MKQIHLNLRKGEAKVMVENMEDLWYLSQIIDIGDTVSGKTFRKIKIGQEPNLKIVRKPVFIKLTVEKIEFSKTTNVLRVGGKITQAPDDVPRGSHHTFNVEEKTTIMIIKEKWLNYQVQKLKEACTTKVPKILIVVHDREEAYFARMKRQGYTLLAALKGDVQKKAIDEKQKGKTLYSQVITKIKEYDQRYDLEKVILASPAFFKEDLMKELKDKDLKQKIILATCSSVGKNGIDEVLKRDETREALRHDRISKEMKFVESLLTEISRKGKAAYGFKETKSAAEAGAVENLLVTDSLIKKMRDKNIFSKLDKLMKKVDQSKGEIHIISVEHHGGKKLDGLGGIGAILRFKMSYE